MQKNVCLLTLQKKTHIIFWALSINVLLKKQRQPNPPTPSKKETKTKKCLPPAGRTWTWHFFFFNTEKQFLTLNHHSMSRGIWASTFIPYMHHMNSNLGVWNCWPSLMQAKVCVSWFHILRTLKVLTLNPLFINSTFTLEVMEAWLPVCARRPLPPPPNTQPHSYETMLVKCPAQGHNDRQGWSGIWTANPLYHMRNSCIYCALCVSRVCVNPGW